MSGKLDINCEILENDIFRMKTSHKEFELFIQNGFTNELEELYKMNSDFVEKYARLLEITQKSDLKKLNENLTVYLEAAQTIYEEIKKADEALAKDK